MLKSQLQSQYRPHRSPARVVQQGAVLFQQLPLCLSGRFAKTVTPRALRPTSSDSFCKRLAILCRS
jgi:hypothetical protein